MGNVSGFRYTSYCRCGGLEFDLGPVPYFHGGHEIISTDFLLPSADSRRVLSVTSESMCTKYWLTACSSLPSKKFG